MLAHIRQEESVDTAASSDRSIFNQLAARKRQSMARTRPQSANFRLRRGGDDDGESEGESEGGGKAALPPRPSSALPAASAPQQPEKFRWSRRPSTREFADGGDERPEKFRWSRRPSSATPEPEPEPEPAATPYKFRRPSSATPAPDAAPKTPFVWKNGQMVPTEATEEQFRWRKKADADELPAVSAADGAAPGIITQLGQRRRQSIVAQGLAPPGVDRGSFLRGDHGTPNFAYAKAIANGEDVEKPKTTVFRQRDWSGAAPPADAPGTPRDELRVVARALAAAAARRDRAARGRGFWAFARHHYATRDRATTKALRERDAALRAALRERDGAFADRDAAKDALGERDAQLAERDALLVERDAALDVLRNAAAASGDGAGEAAYLKSALVAEKEAASKERAAHERTKGALSDLRRAAAADESTARAALKVAEGARRDADAEVTRLRRRVADAGGGGGGDDAGLAELREKLAASDFSRAKAEEDLRAERGAHEKTRSRLDGALASPAASPSKGAAPDAFDADEDPAEALARERVDHDATRAKLQHATARSAEEKISLQERLHDERRLHGETRRARDEALRAVQASRHRTDALSDDATMRDGVEVQYRVVVAERDALRDERDALRADRDAADGEHAAAARDHERLLRRLDAALRDAEAHGAARSAAERELERLRAAVAARPAAPAAAPRRAAPASPREADPPAEAPVPEVADGADAAPPPRAKTPKRLFDVPRPQPSLSKFRPGAIPTYTPKTMRLSDEELLTNIIGEELLRVRAECAGLGRATWTTPLQLDKAAPRPKSATAGKLGSKSATGRRTRRARPQSALATTPARRPRALPRTAGDYVCP